MTRQPVKTAFAFGSDRSFTTAAAPTAEMLRASEVVDYFWVADQLYGVVPAPLWRPDKTPIAQVMRDPDSFADPFVPCGIAAASTGIGLRLGTDATRRGPAELVQSLFTLGALTETPVLCGLGAGEAKQLKPFGHKRVGALARLEDTLRLARMLWECDGPFSYEGESVKWEDAYLGTARPQHRPQIWAIGGGPKLMDVATKYADGFLTAVPNVMSTPEEYAARVLEMRAMVERNGRDPDEFGFGIDFSAIISDDEEVIARSLSNDIIKFIAAIWGRFNQADWVKDGVEPIHAMDYNYAVHFLPGTMTLAEAEGIVSKVSPDMVSKAFIHGTSAEVASLVSEYIEAGATAVGVVDISPLALGVEVGPESVGHTLDVYRTLKKNA